MCFTHTHLHTHTGVNTLTHPYKYILTPPVMCSQQQFLLHWINNLPISKFTLHNSIMPCFSKIILNCKQTHTRQSEKDNIFSLPLMGKIWSFLYFPIFPCSRFYAKVNTLLCDFCSFKILVIVVALSLSFFLCGSFIFSVS